MLQLAVSLISKTDIMAASEVERRSYDDELRILSVGRLETEKNPLLLADVLAQLLERNGRWRLTVCGEGAMAGDLSQRLHELGVAQQAELRGYVPIDGGLLELYRRSHAFLHVSWTEGVPQVLYEAFAAGVPVVATAVGGVPEAVGGAGLLVPAGDAEAAASALARVAVDDSLRRRLVHAGFEEARRHTIEAECRRVADFIRANC